MNESLIISKTKNHIKSLFSDDSSGHDYWHIVRVVNNAKHIAEKENCNIFIVELSAWLHDIGDYKLHNGIDKTEILINEWLRKLKLESLIIAQVIKIVNQVSYKGAGIKTKPTSIEAMIVQDSDRLDAIGAIGIARAFAYGGHKNRPLHDPENKPLLHDDFESYKNSKAATINHFYEKLLLLKDRMNTQTAKNMAIKRHNVMLDYLSQFYNEWDGTA